MTSLQKTPMISLQQMGRAAKDAAYVLSNAPTSQKNRALMVMAKELEAHAKDILEANAKDIQAAREQGLSASMLDRLLLNQSRLEAMASDVRNVASLPDPVGTQIDCKELDNGMTLSRRREPIGVIGVIYEARPNVTIDIASLCLKTGNASILRGGKETLHSNMALVKVIQKALEKAGLPSASVQYIENPDRKYVAELLRLDEFVDMIIPRGGESLHKMCKENSNIPVIIGGFGISHIYVDKTAIIHESLGLIINAKAQRPSACNALDTLLVHEEIAQDVLEKLTPLLNEHGINIVATPCVLPYLSGVHALREVKEGDFDTEWLGLTLNITQVCDVHEALKHMRLHNATHSDAILTEDMNAAETFINGAGSAVVYVNASTRFTDGAQFGLGAEVAVSTQKLHARGPMGLEELTTYKWVGKAHYLSRT